MRIPELQKTGQAFLLIAALAALPMSRPSEKRETNQNRLVGTWRLVSYEIRPTGGQSTSLFGPMPRGRLIYDQSGRVSVHLMDPRRKPFASGDPFIATPEELKAAFDGYFGYFGTYTVDTSAGVVIHHIEGAAYPNYVGTDQKRLFVLHGSRLEVTTPARVRRGVEVTYLSVWEREPNSASATDADSRPGERGA